MNWVRHGGRTTFETKSSYCRVAARRLKRALDVWTRPNPDYIRILRSDQELASSRETCSGGGGWGGGGGGEGGA